MRLMRLESEHADLAKTVAGQEQAVKHLGAAIADVPQLVALRVEAQIAPLISDVERVRVDVEQIGQRMLATADRVGEHHDAIERWQAERKASADRRDAWRKAVLTIVTGSVAILIKEVVQWALKHQW